LANEIVIVARTNEETAEVFARHKSGEIYIRAFGHGQGRGYIWRFAVAVGERAKQWHEAIARKRAGVQTPKGPAQPDLF
jgi:hypothetical protein